MASTRTPSPEWLDRRISYRELDARAARLASHLRAWGADRNSLISIVLPRSPARIIAVLGVLRAGSACLPVDVLLFRTPRGVNSERYRVTVEFV